MALPSSPPALTDIRGMNELAMTAKKSGALILGGGLVKHVRRRFVAMGVPKGLHAVCR